MLSGTSYKSHVYALSTIRYTYVIRFMLYTVCYTQGAGRCTPCVTRYTLFANVIRKTLYRTGHENVMWNPPEPGQFNYNFHILQNVESAWGSWRAAGDLFSTFRKMWNRPSWSIWVNSFSTFWKLWNLAASFYYTTTSGTTKAAHVMCPGKFVRAVTVKAETRRAQRARPLDFTMTLQKCARSALFSKPGILISGFLLWPHPKITDPSSKPDNNLISTFPAKCGIQMPGARYLA